MKTIRWRELGSLHVTSDKGNEKEVTSLMSEYPSKGVRTFTETLQKRQVLSEAVIGIVF